MISASSLKPVIRDASQDRNSLRRSQLAASSSMTCLPGAVLTAGAGGAAGSAVSASAAVLASRRGACLTGATSALALSASAMTAAARIVGGAVSVADDGSKVRSGATLVPKRDAWMLLHDYVTNSPVLRVFIELHTSVFTPSIMDFSSLAAS